MINRILTHHTGRWPSWITFWPIAISKPRNMMQPVQGDPIRLLRRCNIRAVSGGGWLWYFWPRFWIQVPRRQAVRAEHTLRRYGYKLTERPVTGRE